MKEFEIGMRVLIIGESGYPQFTNSVGQTGVIIKFEEDDVKIQYDERPTTNGMWIEKCCIEPYCVEVGDIVIYANDKSELVSDLKPIGSIGIVRHAVDPVGDIRVEFNDGSLWVERKNVRLARTNDDIQRIVDKLRKR